MRARTLLNVVLALAAAILLAGVWWTENRPPARLLPLAPESVIRIAVERSNGGFTLERQGGQWWLTAPRRLPVSEFHVDLLLGLLDLVPAASYPVADLDLAALGLEPPRYQVSFGDRRIAFGDVEPLGQRRYVRLGDTVHLVAERGSGVLAAPWWNFIDRGMLPADEVPHALEFADTASAAPELLAAWRETDALLVEPGMADAAPTLHVRLASGARLPFAIRPGKVPLLIRTDLGLAYQLTPEQFDALVPVGLR